MQWQLGAFLGHSTSFSIQDGIWYIPNIFSSQHITIFSETTITSRIIHDFLTLIYTTFLSQAVLHYYSREALTEVYRSILKPAVIL